MSITVSKATTKLYKTLPLGNKTLHKLEIVLNQLEIIKQDTLVQG